jgi:hypothetical protein
MKTLLAGIVAALSLGGCAVVPVPVAPRHGYVAPAPVVVVPAPRHGHYGYGPRWHHRHWR